MPNSIKPNLSPVVDWQPAMTANRFKQGEPLFSGTGLSGSPGYQWKDGRAFAVDADGYPLALLPGQVVRTVFSAGLDLHYAPGLYDVTWDGDGTLAVSGNAAIVGPAGANAMTVNVAPIITQDGHENGGWHLHITRTNPGNHLRNIDVRRQGTPKTAVFDQDLIALCRGTAFPGFRFMQPQAIDDLGGLVADWKDRPKDPDAQWSRKGMPIEACFNFAGAVSSLGGPQQEVWLCIPHLATDDYVRQFARLLGGYVNNFRIVVEYSNEVWNGIYRQTSWCHAQGLALGYQYLGYPNMTGPTDIVNGWSSRAMLRYYGKRSVECFDIIRAELGAALASRITFVIATQAANAWNADRILEFSPTTGAPAAGGVAAADAVGRRVNALAIAPYPALDFGDDAHRQMKIAHVLALSPDGVVAELRASMDALFARTRTPTSPCPVMGHRTAAARYNIPLRSYEGGPSLVVPTGANDHDAAALVDLYRRANLAPGMRTLVTDILTNWAFFTPEAFAYFCLVAPEGGGQVGSFGAKRYPTQPDADAPKWQALKAWADAHPI